MTYIILLYVFFISLVQIPKHTRAECSHYYTVLNIEPFPTPGTTREGFITPTKLSGKSLDYEYNTTEVYNIIQSNSDCLMEIECVEGTFTTCDERNNFDSSMSTHEFIDTSSEKANLSDIITTGNTPSIPPAVTTDTNQTETATEPEKRRDDNTEITSPKSAVSETETSTEIKEKNTPVKLEEEYPTATKNIAEVNIMTPAENTESPKNTIGPSEDPPSIKSKSPVSSTASFTITDSGQFNSPDDEKYEHLKTAALLVASLGSGAMLIFLTSKIPGILQSGTYRLPDPNIAETGV